jgi:phospholipid/cholesterol/gamma-HCH transport system substrate-binding protein
MTPAPIHRDDARRTVYGVVTLLLLVVVAVLGAIVQRGGALPGRTYTYVTADFTDVGILKPGKEVRQDGVRVGQVASISYTVQHTARVIMRLEGHYAVHQDATAAIGNVSALGKKYVILTMGSDSAPLMAEGTVIPASRTQRSQSLEDIVASLDKPSLLALNGALGTLSDGLAGHSTDLNAFLGSSPDLLSNLGTVAKAASSPRADIPGLMSSANTLVSRFQGREAELRSMVRNTNQTIKALDVGKGNALKDTIEGLPASLDQARLALDTLYAPLGDAEVAVRTLQTGGNSLGAATPALRSFLRTSPATLDKVAGVAAAAKPAVIDLTRTVAYASPLIPRVTAAVGSLAGLLEPFAPYAADTGRFFAQNALLSGTLQGSDDKHYFAALLTAPGAFSVAGLPDPFYRGEFYPKPGTAYNHSTVTDNRKGVR